MEGFGSPFLNFLLGGGIVATVTAGIAAYRKYKSGEIVDDDALIARLDKDNEKLRSDLEAEKSLVEAERRKRWAAEELVAQYRVRLIQYQKAEEHEAD